MKVLVVIVTYNAEKWIHKCVSSVLSSTIEVDIFIIDNGSSDETTNFLKSFTNSHVFLYESKENLGFGKANNIGLQYAINNDYDYVYLLNQDAWIFPDTITQLIKIHQDNPNYGILSPIQMNRNMHNVDKIFIEKLINAPQRDEILERAITNEILAPVYDIPFIMAAHWFISRDCLIKVGGFSPIFPHYGEDENYSERVIFHGFKVGIVPNLKVVHDRGDRPPRNYEQNLYMHYIHALIALSSINKNVNAIWIFKVWRNICCRHKDLKFSQYAYLLLRNYNQIKKNRKQSHQECAFLKIKAK